MTGPPTITTQDGLSRWLTLPRFVALLALVLFALYPQVVLGQASFFYRDFGFFGYPLAAHHREAFWRGEIPLWNPLSNCGLPFLAQWNTMVFYPGSLIYLLLPLSWSLSLFGLCHLLWAGTGMYLLVRRWTDAALPAAVAGLAFALNGLSLNCLMWPNNVAALAWMPWVVWSTERAWTAGGRAVVLAALVAATQFLAGAPEVILQTWLIVGGFWVTGFCRETQWARRLTRLLLFSVLLAALTSVQWLPFLDLLKHSQRTTDFGGADWSMPAWGWANLLVPKFRSAEHYFHVSVQYGQYWTSSYYLGIGVLLLGIVGALSFRRSPVWLLGTIALLGLLLPLGENGLLYAWVQRTTPLLGFMRYPIKFVVLLAFALPALAGLGMHTLCRREGASSPRGSRTVLLSAAGYLLGLVAAVVWFDHQFPILTGPLNQTLTSGLSRALVLLGLTVCLWTLASQSPDRRGIAGTVALVLMIADIATHLPEQNPTIPRSAFRPDIGQPEGLDFSDGARVMVTADAARKVNLSAHPDPLEDFLTTRQAQIMNVNLLDHVRKTDGLYSLYLQPMAALEIELALRGDGALPQPLLDFLGVRKICRAAQPYRWEDRAAYMPRISGGQQPAFVADQQALTGVLSPSFRPREVVYLTTGDAQALGDRRRASVQITNIVLKPHSLAAEVVADAPSVVVVSEAFHPSWKARVNDVSVPVLRANFGFQAVAVPAGRSRIRLDYRDTHFHLGLCISGLGVFLCAVWTLRFSCSTPRRTDSA